MIFLRSAHGIRGILPYKSLYAARMAGDLQTAKAAQHVYRFKVKGQNAAVVRALVEAARDDLQCTDVWVVPGHEKGAVSQLQALFGSTIRRKRSVEPRKYRHKQAFDIQSLSFPRKRPKGRVLVVDDIATSGETLTAVCSHLGRKRPPIQAVPLALGLNWKLIGDQDPAAVMAQWDQFKAQVEADRPRGLTPTEHRRARRAAGCEIERHECEDPDRRQRLEGEPVEWLKWYLPATFKLAFGEVHETMVEAAVRAITTGAGMVACAPRGTGKTAVLWGVALWAILSGQSRFPVMAGFSHGAARRALRKWLSTLAENARLRADYPEACRPFEVTTHSNRLKHLRWEGIDRPMGADVRMGDGCIVLPDGRGALGAVSISGNTRGLYVSLAGGETLRPDVLLVDDPQNKKTAQSPDLTRKVVEVIESDLLSLSGPDTRLAVMAAVTVICEGDVSNYFLDHADYEAVTTRQVTSWPRGWDGKDSPTRALWEAWNQARLAGLEDHDGGEAARQFYAAHKADLAAGMSVSWDERFDRKRADPDAFFAAMWDFYRLGERAFMAERQGRPLSETTAVYTLTVKQVAASLNHRDRLEIPSGHNVVVAFADINRVGLHWCVASFAQDMTCGVLDYGKQPERGDLWPENCRELERKQAIFGGLSALAEKLQERAWVQEEEAQTLQTFLVDRGYEPDTVHQWAQQARYGFRVVPSRGYSAKHYRVHNATLIGSPFENCHLVQGRLGRFLAHNADPWRECVQRAFLGDVGAPGGCTLWGDDPRTHVTFAEHVTSEVLQVKIMTPVGMRWEWAKAPSRPNDLLDALVGCYVAAAAAGLSTAGAPVAHTRRRRPPVRKSRIQSEPIRGRR